MLKKRLSTAGILILGVISLLFFASDLVWSLLCTVVVLLGFWEWGRMFQLNASQLACSLFIASILNGVVIYAFNTTYVQIHEWYILTTLISAAFIWLIFVPAWLSFEFKLLGQKFLMTAVGIILLSSTLIALIGLRHISPWLLLGVIATVSIADSAAYFAGKRFGQHKLAPSISPGKTWEGVIGAFVAVTFYALSLCYFLGYSAWLLIGLLLIVVLSIMGDLFESKLKRQANIKDSGNLLPGHGGILDRIDGLMPSTALTLLYIYLPLFFSNKLHV